jgi:hypothetical protein
VEIPAPPPPPPKPVLKPEPKSTPKPEPPKAPPPAPKVEAPKPPEPTLLDRKMASARDLIREAAPEFCALAEPAATWPPSEQELFQLLARIDAVDRKLSRAREEYRRVIDESPDPILLQRRIRILDELRTALRSYRDRCADSR